MKIIGLLLIAILAEGIGHGAGVVPPAATNDHKPCVDLMISPPSEEDTDAFKSILFALAVDSDTFSLYVSHDSKVKQQGGAMSFTCEIPNHEIYGTYERWIVYDPDLIKGDAARDFVFAHEIAHHMEFQTLSGPRSKKEELRADYDAAQYLHRLGWNAARLRHALDLLNLPQDSQHGYPTLEERKAIVESAVEQGPGAPTNVQAIVTSNLPPPYEENLQKLLNLTYRGPIQFQSVRTNKYVCAIGTPYPKLPSTSTFALFDNCEWDSRVFFDLRIRSDGNLGYWIFQRANPCPVYAGSCDYAWESVGQQLQFWNQNLAADEYREEKELGEQELFSLEASNPSKGLFRIKVRKGGFIFADPNSGKLQSGGSREQAAEFKVLFELAPPQ